jgi:hypothetical protein
MDDKIIKIRRVVLTVFTLGIVGLCGFLANRSSTFQVELVELREEIAMLESTLNENAELRDRLSRRQAAQWELETLRKQAQDVHRLRAQVSELFRLRRENLELNLQLSQLTNQVHHLAQQNEVLPDEATARRRIRVAAEEYQRSELPGAAGLLDSQLAEADSTSVSNKTPQDEVEERDAANALNRWFGKPRIYSVPHHSQSNLSYISCHDNEVKSQGKTKPAALGFFSGQQRSGNRPSKNL